MRVTAQYRRYKVLNRGLYVPVGAAWHCKNLQNSNDLQCFLSQFGGLGALFGAMIYSVSCLNLGAWEHCLGRDQPPKSPPRGDGADSAASSIAWNHVKPCLSPYRVWFFVYLDLVCIDHTGSGQSAVLWACGNTLAWAVFTGVQLNWDHFS